MSEALFITITIGFVLIFVTLISYWCETDSTYPKIKFEAFKKFYAINPDRWALKDTYVICQIVNEEKSAYRGLFHTYSKEIFYFTFFGYIKYKIFRKQLAKDILNAKHMESTANMLSMVKKDITNMEELAEQQKKKAIENFETILKNLK